MKEAPYSTCLRICLALGLIFGSWGCALHYGDLVPGRINGQTFEYHISRADVAAHAVEKVHYSP